MAFESFGAPEIAPDAEQAQVWKNVRRHFESALSTEEENSTYDDEAQERIGEVLAAIDEQDYSKAYEFLERQIALMKNYHELAQGVALADKADMPKLLEEEIAKLEELRDSLNLEEK